MTESTNFIYEDYRLKWKKAHEAGDVIILDQSDFLMIELHGDWETRKKLGFEKLFDSILMGPRDTKFKFVVKP